MQDARARYIVALQTQKRGKCADLKIGYYKQSGVKTLHSTRANSEVGPYNGGGDEVGDGVGI